MEEMVSTGLLTSNEFTALIASSTFFFEGAVFLAEQLPQHVVTQAQRKELLRCEPFNAKAQFAYYTSGRIFTSDFELRWEKEEDNFRVVYIGTMRAMTPLVERDLNLEKKEPTKPYYLFGELLEANGRKKIGSTAVKGDFAILRIPRLLHYPVETPKRYVQLYIQEYVDKGTGDVALFRFQTIEPKG